MKNRPEKEEFSSAFTMDPDTRRYAGEPADGTLSADMARNYF